MYCLVAYDITDNKRRSKLFKTMKGFGQRTQFSIFECELPEHQFKSMLAIIENIICATEDNIKVYVLCRNCLKTLKIMGTARILTKPEFIIV